MSLTAPLGTNLHVEKKFGRGGSHCATREELERRQVSLGGIREEAGPYTQSLASVLEIVISEIMNALQLIAVSPLDPGIMVPYSVQR